MLSQELGRLGDNCGPKFSVEKVKGKKKEERKEMFILS